MVFMPENVSTLNLFQNTGQKTCVGGLKRCIHNYNDIISLENLLEAWKEFVRGKRSRKDIQLFERDLMRNIISLHNDLKNKTYRHSAYQYFRIADPKPRDIHKATVRDRLLHHTIYKILYLFFARNFTSDSYSCQNNKGTHRALRRFRRFFNTVSQNNTHTVWVLKCDIKKFFANIDHNSLCYLIAKYIPDENINWLLSQIVESFHSTRAGVGLPLGNLTSQLLVNIYMNEFDQFMKHKLKVKYYIRYADDFAVFSQSRLYFKELLPKLQKFLIDTLKLSMHPNKIHIRTVASGIDFLGWVHFPNHRILRTVTKRRMFKNLSTCEVDNFPQAHASYLRILKHGNAYKISLKISRNKSYY